MHTQTEIAEVSRARINALQEGQATLAVARDAGRGPTAEERAKIDKCWLVAEERNAAVDVMVEENRVERDIVAGQERPESGRGMSSEREAFNDELRQGLMSRTFSREIRFEFDALTEHRTITTDSASGGLVPEDFIARVYEARRDNSAILSAGAEVIRTETGSPIPLPIVSTAAIATAVAEGGTFATASGQPDFTSHDLTAHKYGRIVPVSFELLRDNGVDLAGWLAGHLGRALAHVTDAQYLNGDGSSKPLGILDATAGAEVAFTLGTAGSISWSEVRKLEFSVDGGYVGSSAASDGLPMAGRPSWLMRRSTLGDIYALADDNGYPIFRARTTEMDGDSLDGYQVFNSNQIAAFGTASGAKAAAFGNFFDAMAIREVNSLRLDIDSSVYFTSDMVAFRGIVETDSHVRDRGAVKVAANA